MNERASFTRSRPTLTRLRAELIPEALVSLPEPVREARERAVDAIDALERAREAAVAARRTADAAPRLDAEAKHEAIRANRKPPKSTAPAATEAAADADAVG